MFKNVFIRSFAFCLWLINILSSHVNSHSRLLFHQSLSFSWDNTLLSSSFGTCHSNSDFYLCAHMQRLSWSCLFCDSNCGTCFLHNVYDQYEDTLKFSFWSFRLVLMLSKDMAQFLHRSDLYSSHPKMLKSGYMLFVWLSKESSNSHFRHLQFSNEKLHYFLIQMVFD